MLKNEMVFVFKGSFLLLRKLLAFGWVLSCSVDIVESLIAFLRKTIEISF